MEGTGVTARTRITPGLGVLHVRDVPGPTAGLAGEHAAFVSASGCSVIVEHELLLWHLSIAHPDRYPTWDEIADARYRLVPDDVTMAMLLPPSDEYVNEHPHCFHLWQVDDRRAV